MKTEKGVYRKNRWHMLKTEESQTPVVTTDDVPVEIESDAAPVATTPDNPETQPVDIPVTTTDLVEQSECQRDLRTLSSTRDRVTS